MVELRNQKYEIIRNDDECFDKEIVEDRIKETDYFDDYDYILGDFAYDKVRLKGYYDTKNNKKTEINDFATIDDYIENYCQMGSKIFILKKEK
ncbi:MAG: YutD family protein [Bacilli bacterium]|nr:YutD family protein [Bacilli bacterium]